MEARFACGGWVFKAIIESLKDLVNESNLVCEAGGISLQAMDSSHVALVELKLPASGFAYFRCDAPVNLGLNLKVMASLLKLCDKEDVVTLSYSSSHPDELQLLFESTDGNRMSHFTHKLMDIDQEQMGIPDTDFPVKISMPSAEFQGIVRDLKELDDVVELLVGKEGVCFAVNGPTSSGKITRQPATMDQDNPESLTCQYSAPCAVKLALRYLNMFGKATALAPRVSIHFGPDLPVNVAYTMHTIGTLQFYLAPKMEDM